MSKNTKEDTEVGEVVVRVNINVPSLTRERWKIAAVQRRVSMADLIVSSVEKELKMKTDAGDAGQAAKADK